MIDWRVYLITDRHSCDNSIEKTIRDACRAGVRAVQLREKDLDGRALYSLAEALRAETSGAGGCLLVNDRLDVAMAVGADGVHCPEQGFPPERARFLLGAGGVIGASVHSPEAAMRAEAAGADFLTFGPVYHTPSKTVFGDPQGPGALQTVCARVGIPVFAIGGVTPDNAPACLEHGAYGVAVIHSIIGAPDVGAAVARFQSALGSL